MIKALRAAAAKVPFQKDKMASPSRLCVTPSVCGEGGVAGATPWTESSCFIMFPGFYLDTIKVLQDKSGLTIFFFFFFFFLNQIFFFFFQEESVEHEAFQGHVWCYSLTQWASVSALSQAQDLLNDFLVMDEHSSSLHSDSCLTCTAALFSASHFWAVLWPSSCWFFFSFLLCKITYSQPLNFFARHTFSTVETVQYNV